MAEGLLETWFEHDQGRLLAVVTNDTRAMVMLTNSGLVDRTEYGQARAVLNAAALTYVAGLAAAVLQLLYYISLASGMGRRRYQRRQRSVVGRTDSLPATAANGASCLLSCGKSKVSLPI